MKKDTNKVIDNTDILKSLLTPEKYQQYLKGKEETLRLLLDKYQ